MKHTPGNPIKIPSERHGLQFNRAITRWDEALPLGNGLTGCLVWGDGAPLRFSLDRGDLWDLRPAPETLSEEFTYPKLIEWVRDRKEDKIHALFDEIFYRYPHPTKLPAGRIELDFGQGAGTVESRLDIGKACAEVRMGFGETSVEVRSFLHAVNGLGYIEVSGHGADWRLRVVPPDYAGSAGEGGSEDLAFAASLSLLGYPAASPFEEVELTGFHQKTVHRLEYAVIAAQRKTAAGKTREIVYTVACSRDGDDWLENAKRKVLTAVREGYAAGFRDHVQWWESYWGKSSITLPDREMEQMWYLNNYLFGSCSRKGCPPMPLQGVWTADEGVLPPWKGDYHNDLNTQLCYWHYLKANHLEEGESFLDFLWDLLPQARAFARSFFDAPGANLPSVMTIEGGAMGGWPMYSLSITNQIWLCQAFDHYWLYTGDRRFLQDKAYVYFRETAACLLRWLEPGDDGKLRLPLSSSPEIHDNSLRAWVTPNSNYDLSLLIYLFSRLAEMAEQLDLSEEAAAWRGTLDQLPELAVNEGGVLMVSPDESLAESHRHMSHMMAVYPLQLLDYRGSERDRAIIDASIHQLEMLGKGLWVGYSFAWMAALYAKQGNGEAALYHLRQLWTYMCSPNGFHLNGDYTGAGVTVLHYRPFTLEGNMAAADALQEMLLGCDRALVRVFPAIPRAWASQDIEFRQLRAEGGVLVSAGMQNGRLTYIELHAERDGVFRVRNDFAVESLRVQVGELDNVQEHGAGSVISVALKAGEACRIVSAIA